MNSNDNADQDQKLDILVNLIAHQIADSKETLSEKAQILDRLGLDKSRIARVCGSSPGAVRARLSEVKKKVGK